MSLNLIIKANVYEFEGLAPEGVATEPETPVPEAADFLLEGPTGVTDDDVDAFTEDYEKRITQRPMDDEIARALLEAFVQRKAREGWRTW